MINHFRPHPIGVNKPNLEIPMSHQKMLQGIGVEQPRPRECYINDCRFEKSSLEQQENVETQEVGDSPY